MVRLAPLPAVEALNELPVDRFAEAVGPLFERAPRFLARLAAARPFAAWDDLFDRALEIGLAMPQPEQVELIDSHPRLGADSSAVRALSELAYREQGYDRPPGSAAPPLESADADRVDAELARVNDAYERRFGFRFVVFVAGRSRAELLPIMRAALSADPDAEIQRALADVVAVARDRAVKMDPRA